MNTKSDNAIKTEDKDVLLEQVDVKGDESLQKIAKDQTEPGNSSVELKNVSGDTSLQISPKSNTSEHNPGAMSKLIEPPAFISDQKSYAEYKKDLKRWSRICGVEKKLQAEIVVGPWKGGSDDLRPRPLFL